MSYEPLISHIGHLSIGVTDVDAGVRAATQLMGMHLTERTDDSAYLRLGTEHHTLHYVAAERNQLDHFGLVAASPAALGKIRARVNAAGLTVVSETPLDAWLPDGFAFVGPEGFTFEVYVGMPAGQDHFYPAGVRPARLGHFTLNPQDPDAMRRFFEEVLGFRLVDTIVGEGYFLRCNAEHHGIGLLGGRGTFHHSGWQVQSIAELGLLGDLLFEHDRSLLWGPVRHGAGENIAAYFDEPAGSVIEYYADMEVIYDEAFVPRTWDSNDPRWYTRWSPGRPVGFRDFGLPPAPR